MSGEEVVVPEVPAQLLDVELLLFVQEVIKAKDLAAQRDVRLMASVYFKNGGNKYWRNKRGSMGINSEEKLYLTQKLLAHLREENYQVWAYRVFLVCVWSYECTARIKLPNL